MAAPTLTVFNAGASIGFPPDPNQTGPLYYGAALSTGLPFSMPLGWVLARTPAQPVGWYRITHNLGFTRYAVFGTSRNNPRVVASPTNYQSAFFDIETCTLPSAADSDQDFGFLLIVLP